MLSLNGIKIRLEAFARSHPILFDITHVIHLPATIFRVQEFVRFWGADSSVGSPGGGRQTGVDLEDAKFPQIFYIYFQALQPKIIH